MLKSENGAVEIKGYQSQLMIELGVLFMALVEKHVVTKEDLHAMVDKYGKTEKQFVIDHIDGMDNIGDAFNLLMKVMSDRRLDD